MSKLLNAINAQFENDVDFKNRSILIGDSIKVTLLHLDGLASGDKISQFVLQPLMMLGNKAQTVQQLIQSVLFSAVTNELTTTEQCKQALLRGNSLLFIEGKSGALEVDTVNDLGRAVAEPPTSGVIKGPREGFVENFKVNLMLIRKRLRTNNLKTNMVSVGKYSNTTVVVCYLEGIANAKIVKNITQRIKQINIDGIIDSSYVGEFLCGRSTLFRQTGNSEKPDVIASRLLEGRVAVVVDGSPIVLTFPYMFIEDLQSPDDYYTSSQTATIARFLRLFSVLVSILLPSLFVSLQLYNYQIIPGKFLVTIINSTDAIPFSPLAEMLVVVLLFDVLREANSRMPKAGGMALNIVGAIVLGDAAVKAGLLGAPAVVIGALSGIGLYSMPDNTLSFSVLRMGFVVVGGLTGIFGLMIAVLLLLTYLVSLSNYGTPYFAPISPCISQDRDDAVLKGTLVKNKHRPFAISSQNKTRQGENTWSE